MGWEAEVSAGQRFEFGENWRRYLAALDEAKLKSAKASLVNMLVVARTRVVRDQETKLRVNLN
jgi:hypothetical protein